MGQGVTSPLAKIEPNGIVLDPVTAAVVRWMFAQYASGLISLRGIANALNERGEPTPSVRAGKGMRAELWSVVSVRCILRSETYLGHLVWNKVGSGRFLGVVNLQPMTRPNGKKKCRKNASEVLIRRTDTHDPLVDRRVGTIIGGPGLFASAIENGVRAIPITILLKDSYPAGQNDETVVLTTDDPLYPELRVPIRVLKRKAGAIVPSPDSVEVRVSKSLEESSTLLQLRAPNRGAIRIAKIDCDHPAIRTRFAPDAALAVTVRVIVTREGAHQQNGQATLHVTFAEPSGETLAIPVSWILEK